MRLARDRQAARYEWRRAGKLIQVDHTTTGALEAKIWLLALVPSLVLALVGLGASTWRRGLYVVALAAILIPLATTHRLDRWSAHHRLAIPSAST